MKGKIWDLKWESAFENFKWECVSCGTCCSYYTIYIDGQDSERLRKHGKRGHIAKDPQGKEYIRKKRDESWNECSLLENRLCTVHPYKPACCFIYPYTMEVAANGVLRVQITHTCPNIGKGRNVGKKDVEPAVKRCSSESYYREQANYWKGRYEWEWKEKFPDYKDLGKMEKKVLACIKAANPEPPEIYRRIMNNNQGLNPHEYFAPFLRNNYVNWLNEGLERQYFYVSEASGKVINANGRTIPVSELDKIEVPGGIAGQIKDYLAEVSRRGYSSQITLNGKQEYPLVYYATNLMVHYEGVLTLSRLMAFMGKKKEVGQGDYMNGLFAFEYSFKGKVEEWIRGL